MQRAIFLYLPWSGLKQHLRRRYGVRQWRIRYIQPALPRKKPLFKAKATAANKRFQCELTACNMSGKDFKNYRSGSIHLRRTWQAVIFCRSVCIYALQIGYGRAIIRSPVKIFPQSKKTNLHCRKDLWLSVNISTAVFFTLRCAFSLPPLYSYPSCCR